MKSTTKSAKSPAPATPTASAPAPAPKITRVPRVKKDSASVPAAPTPPTLITAKIDVGFGNTLFLRGDGPGLSWNKGVALACAEEAAWTISLANAVRPVVFKFLINDETWSRGEDYTAAPGSKAELSPTF
jgi:hypothetical protein